MAGTGRKPIPTALKIARGTYRQDRHGDPDSQPAPDVLTKVPTAPRTLGKVGRKKWKDTAGKLIVLGLLTPVDLDALEIYCAAWDELAICDAELEKTGAYFTADSGYMGQHPVVNRRFKAIDNIRRFMTEFGMTPSSRTSVQVTTPPKSGVRTRTRGA